VFVGERRDHADLAEATELSQRGAVGNQKRSPDGNCFEADDTLRLVVAEERDQIRRPEELGHLPALLRIDEDELDDVAHTQSACKGLEAGPIGTIADDVQHHIRDEFAQLGKRFDDAVMSLVTLEPTDGADDRP
jgi:hypothetical protein